MLKIYEYKNCSSCKKALKYLDARSVVYEKLAIRETPPSVAELKEMAGYLGDIRKLFNTSGMDYRSLGLKDKLPTMSEAEKFKLLHGNGNLVKRPFLIGEGFGTVGFKEAVWDEWEW